MRTLLVFFACILLLACNSDQNKKATIIAGQIESIKSDSIFLAPVNSYFPGTNPSKSRYIRGKTDSSGSFLFRIENFEPGYYQVLDANFPKLSYDLYIDAGDSLYIDKPKWGSKKAMTISGSGATKLNYLDQDAKNYNLKDLIYDTIRTNGFATELDFKAYLDSIYNTRIKTLEEDVDSPKELKEHFKNSLIAEKAKLLLDHMDRRNYIMQGEFDYFYPDEAYYEFKEEIAQIDTNIYSKQLYLLAQPLLNHRAQLAFKNRSEDAWWDDKASWKMSYLKSRPNNVWKDILALGSTMDYALEIPSPAFFDSLKSISNHLVANYSSNSLHTLFSNEVSSTLKLAPGEKAPDFELPDATGKLHKLSDYEGQVVYIDFWGTWCYPCIQEIPDALKLQEAYKDKPVKFLYVAMEYDDENIANWRNFIQGKDERFGKFLDHKPFPGIHLVAEKQMRNPEISPYLINFAPTHVLIDQNGNIVNARAKRSNEISTVIDSLLNNGNTSRQVSP